MTSLIWRSLCWAARRVGRCAAAEAAAGAARPAAASGRSASLPGFGSAFGCVSAARGCRARSGAGRRQPAGAPSPAPAMAARRGSGSIDPRRRRRHLERRTIAPGVFARAEAHADAARASTTKRPATSIGLLIPALIPAQTLHACGNISLKRVPRPGVDCTSTSPSCSWTMR